jgi:hypothetical protein
MIMHFKEGKRLQLLTNYLQSYLSNQLSTLNFSYCQGTVSSYSSATTTTSSAALSCSM